MWQLSGDGQDETSLGCPQPQFTYVHLHGVLMYAAWGLLFPLGVLLGRYYRWAWPCWFIFHVILQVSSELQYCLGTVQPLLYSVFNGYLFVHTHDIHFVQYAASLMCQQLTFRLLLRN